jgi:hypothetical protein
MSEHDEQARLARALHQQAGHVHDSAPIGLDDVRRSARGIRRRRRIASGALAAAVVAVAVPVGLTVAGTTGPDRPAGPAAASPSSSSSPSPGAEPPLRPAKGIVPLTARGAERGQAPQVDYLAGATLHLADGSAVALPATYASVTPYRGGFLAAESGDGDYQVTQLDSSLREVSRAAGDAGFALSEDRTEVAWSTVEEEAGGRGVLHRAIASGMGDEVAEQTMPTDRPVSPVGFVSPEDVVYQTYGEQPQVRVTDLAGKDRVLDRLIAARGTSQATGLVSGQLSFSDDGSCWAVRRVTSDSDLFETCDYSLGQFSPDGRYVVAGPAYLDGIGNSEIAVLDARTGDPVAQWQRPRDSSGFLTQSVWEDSTHLVTTWFEDGAWHLLRLDVSGAITEALEPVRADMVETPWTFLPRP